ncbi:hypothetical protein P3T76_010477 [Phytophthora citrophthora]|uniref:EF-hand domain-containing protein n=1 Tax=Phytophthora citrophthora TaxID=4793 RepID=A0AAD9LHF6_9STRA|nr:hypothetical protein P3T76_010477 [Phytophthora citrophthora]
MTDKNKRAFGIKRMSRQPPLISTRDVQEYLHKQTKLCDSRIENAYMRLSGRNSESRPSSPIALEHKSLSASCNLPSRKHLVIDTVTRPSSAYERRANTEEKPRGILKKTQSPVATLGRKRSPDEWFQHVMTVKKLSPIDLCDLFSYGDARKHPLVSLSHVCEVLYELDPEAANGADPFTEEMEEFLYQFATESKGEILVNIRQALRALDIWQSRVTSSVVPSNLASDLESKAEILKSKNKKLQQVISNLQDANLRLSQQLDSAKLVKSAEELTSVASALPSREKFSSGPISPVKHDTRHSQTFPPSSRHNPASSSRKLSVVNLHEQELVEMASQLQFTGVKRLEELLIQGDEDSTGFVNLKELCWILADQFDLKVSEVRLIEVCMGMNFNAGAQLDYKEFVNVLMDILIYALPDIRESAKRKCLLRLDEYFQSGFPPGREGIRKLLDSLSSKFDLGGDQMITIADLIRVLHVQLVKYHALGLPFPLEEHETIQLAQPFIQREDRDEGYLNYTEFLDGLLGASSQDCNSGDHSKRAFQWEFWRSIYMSLCGGDSHMEHKVQTQLDKIMAKVDSEKTFLISTRHFARIFERHLSPEEMEILSSVLEVSGRELRYDVLLNLVFGSPSLHDDIFFNSVRKKLLREQKRIEHYLMTEKSSHKLHLQDFHEVFSIQAQEQPLKAVELLFLFASADSRHEGAIEAKELNDFLSVRCWKEKKSHNGEKHSVTKGEIIDAEDIRKLISKSCLEYDLLGKLTTLSRNTQGWTSQEVLLKEVDKMLKKTGNRVRQEDLKSFVQNLFKTTNSRRDGIFCDALFDGLIDWEAVATSLRLPNSLVEVKKVFDKFDWEHTGVIPFEDWNKAYRLISVDRQAMAEWEIKVLQRKFPGPIQHEQQLKIDYDHFILFLLEFQQRQARKSLQLRVVKLFQHRLPSTVSTAELERVFQSLDTDKKGYFNAADLKLYLTKEFALESDQEPASIDLLNNEDALAAVMRFLTGDKDNPSASSDNTPVVVSFQLFREIVSSFNSKNHKTSNLGNQIAAQVHPTSPKTNSSASQSISSLRALEIAILNIAGEFLDPKGNILPSQAFRYFTFGPSNVSTSPSSPLRRSLNSPTRGSSRSRTQRELEACDLDPLTPTHLKRLLVNYHNLEVSTHLISQFFLHIGSPSKHFLDLLHFAQWVAPLPVELQVKVRGVVRQMIVKGKAGGGKLDIERFIIQLQRRLQGSPQYMANRGSQEEISLQFVPMPLLLSKLHQLNIPLLKQELMTLFRHFGMEGNLEKVDYALFLQRLYELNTFINS